MPSAGRPWSMRPRCRASAAWRSAACRERDRPPDTAPVHW